MILCAGEALIDMLPSETAEGGTAFAPHAGGAVMNTAVALGRLGVPVDLFTGLSSDLFGDVLRGHLAASDVGTQHVVLSDRPTTLAFVKLVDGHASYAFYDENTAGRMLTTHDLPDVSPQALFVGGISLAVEPCAIAYQALAAQLASQTLVMVDPNIRPAFVKDEAAFRNRMSAMLDHCDILKVSDEDLAWLVPGQSVNDAAGLLVERGVKLVCITRGAKGATGYTADHTVMVDPPETAVVDTVGAGDTFNAGVLAQLYADGLLTKTALGTLSADAIARVLAFGAKVAAVTVGRAGANPPWASEV